MFSPKTVAKVLEPFQKAIAQLEYVCKYHEEKIDDIALSIAELQASQQESVVEADRAAKLVSKLRAILE